MKPRKAETKAKEQPAAGTHVARLLGIVDLGHQPGFVYSGKTVESSWKYEFTYELVNHVMTDGRPFVVSEDLANNNWEDVKTGKRSTLVARARSLMGENYKEALEDVSKLLSQPCMVSVEINDGGYARVRGQSAVGSVPFGMEIKELANEPYTFDMEDPDMDLWEKFPEFKQGKLRSALNFNDSALARALAEQSEF